MTHKTGYLGYGQSTPGASPYLSPQNPYAGDGRTTRSPHDPVVIEFQSAKKTNLWPFGRKK